MPDSQPVAESFPPERPHDTTSRDPAGRLATRAVRECDVPPAVRQAGAFGWQGADMRRMIGGLVVAGFVSAVAPAALAQEAANAGASAANGSAPAASAAQSPADEPDPKRVTLAAGIDLANAYLFRGIFQEDSGVIVPPFVDVGVSLYQGDGALSSVTANGGIWNSLHSGPSGSGTEGRSAWYEADYYASVTFTVGKWKPGALYTAYTSPNDVFATTHELAGVLAYDDSGSAFPLNPKAIVAVELEGQADGGGGLEDGGNQGTYLELGVRPVVTVVDHGRYPLTLAIPAKIGLSLKDYYEGPTGSNRFGFFDLGGIVSVPLAFMNGKSTWEVHGGVDVYWLGDNNKLLNGGDGVKPVAVVGVSVVY